jgi:hypothetical protein
MGEEDNWDYFLSHQKGECHDRQKAYLCMDCPYGYVPGDFDSGSARTNALLKIGTHTIFQVCLDYSRMVFGAKREEYSILFKKIRSAPYLSTTSLLI